MKMKKLNKGKNRKMTRCKMCRNAGVRGSRRSSSSRSDNRMTRTKIKAANRLFNSAFNSAVVKPVRRALCCEANSDEVSPHTRRIMTGSKSAAVNKEEAQRVRDLIVVDPRVASAFEKKFGDSNLSIGKNGIIAIREPPPEQRYLNGRGPYTYEVFEKFFGPRLARLRWDDAVAVASEVSLAPSTPPQSPKKKRLDNYSAIPDEVVDEYPKRTMENKSAVRNTPGSKKRTQKRKGIFRS